MRPEQGATRGMKYPRKTVRRSVQRAIKAYAAIPAILALAGAAFVMKPEEMRRDPLLEARGMVGLAAIYEVMYSHCRAETPSVEAVHMTVGGLTQRFPARSDEDAAKFSISAHPQCDVASLYRLEPNKPPLNRSKRFTRTRLEIRT